MSGIATAIVGGAVIGGIATSSAADKTASAQENGANRADATERYMYDTTRADNAPFLANGTAGNNLLAYRLGLGFNGANGYDTSQANFDSSAYLAANPDVAQNWGGSAYDHWIQYGQNEGRTFTPTQTALQQAQAAKSDPSYGSLLRDFTKDDLNNDVVYQSGLKFGLDQGTEALNRQAAASGQLLSGATLKELSKYANDYASTKAGDSYNRFNNNRQQTYNMLAGISGTGQVASNQVAQAGTNAANNISQNQLAVGNARGASAIAGANAVTGGISQGWNTYQQSQLINKLGYQPNANGMGANPYGGYDAAANGGWGIE